VAGGWGGGVGGEGGGGWITDAPYGVEWGGWPYNGLLYNATNIAAECAEASGRGGAQRV
jgi:hypothetical protein